VSPTLQTILCLIIARGGSKGLPQKNLKDLGGVPLIARPILYAKESQIPCDIVVSTDDNEIATIARHYGAITPFIRPSGLASDHATTESVLQHAVIELESMGYGPYEFCIFLTATDIFRPQSQIAKGIEFLKSNPEIDSYFIGQKTTKNYWEKNEDNQWQRVREWMEVYSSRQQRQHLVREDTGLLSISRANFWREGRRIGDSVEIEVLDDSFTSIDIHSQEDLDLAKAALKIRGVKDLK
jgi:CMP-N-acetylneuraminic acid synthetase